jgi:integrase
LLACYTGCRLSELCQLRTQDVAQIEEVWCIRLAPEAGSLKNRGSERLIPLHPAVIASGFLDFVRVLKPGPIFGGLQPDRFGSRGGAASHVIGHWVRALGLVDKRLSPSHSWRHRFKTLCRQYGVPVDIAYALCGHGRNDVAARYGEYPVSALYRGICQIPQINI